MQGTVSTVQSDLSNLTDALGNEGIQRLAYLRQPNLTTTVGTKAAQSQVDRIESQIGLSFSSTYNNVKDAVVDIAYVDRNDSSTYVGTGWFYRYDGREYIVTAAHVGQDYDTTGTTSSRYSNRIYATILNHNNTGKDVTVRCLPIAADSRADIMILVPYDGQTRVAHHNVLAFGRSRDATPGTTCMIVGNARGYDVGSCSTGVIRDNAFVFPQGVETMFVAAPCGRWKQRWSHCGRVRKRHWFPHVWVCQRRDAWGRGGPVHDGAHRPQVDRARGNATCQFFPVCLRRGRQHAHDVREPKGFFNGTSYRIQTSDVFLYFPGMLGVNPSVPRQGMMFLNVSSPSPVQSNDVVYEITYTPNDAMFDPNYNGGNPVTIPIGSTNGPSPTQRGSSTRPTSGP